MKHFTLINQLTEQYTIVIADNKRIAQRIAVDLAIDLGLDHDDNHVAYWIEKQDYLSINGYTELKAPEDVKQESNNAYEQLTLEQVRESFKSMKTNIEFLQQKAGDATTVEACRMAHRELESAKEALDHLKTTITKYLMTGEW